MSETETCELTGSLGVSSIAMHYAQLSQSFNRDGAVRLDLSSVTDLDASVIQLLLALQKRASEMNAKFELAEVPARVKNSLVAAGVSQLLVGDSKCDVEETTAG